MRQTIPARGLEPLTPPIRVGEGRRGLASGPADPRWLAAVALLACVAAGLMAIPLSTLSERRVLVAATGAAAADATPTANAVVGVRGDPVGAKDERPASPSLFERRLEHLRMSRRTLRAYTYILAKPAFAGTGATEDAPPGVDDAPRDAAQDARQDARLDASQDARQGAPGAPAGLVGSRRAEPAGVPINITTVARTAAVAAARKVIVFQDGNTPAAILAATGMAAGDAAAAGALLGAQAAERGRAFAAGDLVELSGAPPAHAAPDDPLPDWQDPEHPNDAADGGKPFRVAITRGGAVLGAVALGDDGAYAAVAPAAAGAAPAAGAGLDDFSAASAAGVSMREGLYALVDQGKLDRPLVDAIIRICAHDVDVEAPAGRDDTVSALVSPETSDGRPQAEVAYVSVTAGGRERSFYRFAGDHGATPDYFNDAGQSVSRFLLRKPVAAGRLGDGFGWRTHPVLGDRRFHEGVDYAAPYGSPIVAAGAGVVEKIDAQWGYGKYVRVKHDQGYETTYAHIAGTPAAVRVGTRVAQGDTIAYVGSTGLSTGPHLYYEVRINGRDVDPLRIKLAGGAILRGEELAAFALRKHRIDLLLKDARDGAGLQVAGETH